jgi:DNA-binding transcriptional ArsR family regulator
MPAELRTSQGLEASVRVAVSAPKELALGLFLVLRRDREQQHQAPAWLPVLLREHPSLHQRIVTFWDEAETSGYSEWGELVVIAWRTGTLFDEEMERFFDRFDAAVQEPIAVPPLPSEETGVREIIQSRLDRLRSSGELRAGYVALLKDFWAVLRPFWDGGGHALALRDAADLRRQLRGTTDLRSILPRTSFFRKERFVLIIDEALRKGEVVLIPLSLAGEGKCLFSLPGAVLLGHGPEADVAEERRRGLVERAASRFKVLADPTRLAILAQVTHAPTSMTDLALRFELSQPTVSVHMKMLREAGLVDAEKSGSHTLYRSDEARLRAFVEAAAGDVGYPVQGANC